MSDWMFPLLFLVFLAVLIVWDAWADARKRRLDADIRAAMDPIRDAFEEAQRTIGTQLAPRIEMLIPPLKSVASAIEAVGKKLSEMRLPQ